MAGSQQVVAALKAELKRAGITYAMLARELGLAESSVKRIFARGDLTLSRIDEVLRVLKMDFAELAQAVLRTQPGARRELTLAQERAVVADPKLLLVAICVLSLWTPRQIVAAYRLSEPECVAYLHVLARLDVVELRGEAEARDAGLALDRLSYRLKVDKTFRWRPDGPLMAFFRARVAPDYFAGRFDDEGEALMMVHGAIARPAVAAFEERLRRLGQDFAQQHLADQSLPAAARRPFTLVLAMRSWLFAAFRELERDPATTTPA